MGRLARILLVVDPELIEDHFGNTLLAKLMTPLQNHLEDIISKDRLEELFSGISKKIVPILE